MSSMRVGRGRKYLPMSRIKILEGWIGMMGRITKNKLGFTDQDDAPGKKEKRKKEGKKERKKRKKKERKKERKACCIGS